MDPINIDNDKTFKNIINSIIKKKGDKPAQHRHAAFIYDFDDEQMPASMPVLRLSANNQRLFLTVCSEGEESGAFTYKIINDLSFDLYAFLDALSLVIDSDKYEFSYSLDPIDED